MFRWKPWLVIGPVAVFVLSALMASCGGGGGCFGSFNSQGFFVVGLCPSASPSPGFALSAINICNGPPPPTPSPTSGVTATPTACPQATSTGVGAPGDSIPFNAQGVLVKGKDTTYADITNAVSTLWTANNNPAGGPPVLEAPSTGDGGVYTGLNQGCACIMVSSGGIRAQPVTVSVTTPAAGCPPCPTLTPTATPTATPKASAATSQAEVSSGQTSGGTVLWTFDARSPVTGPIVAGPDGSVNFITADSILHSIDQNGRQIFDRPAGGLAPAIGPDGTIYVQGTTSWLYALDGRGHPKWKLDAGLGIGPVAADDKAVYSINGGSLVAAAEGRILWSIAAENPVRAATIAGGVVLASSGGSVTAYSQSGSRMWSFAPAGGFSGDLVAGNGLVYLGSRAGGVYALDSATGAPVWQTPSSTAVIAGPAVSGTGNVFFGSDALYAVDPNGAPRWSSKSLTPVPSGVAALTTGTLFDAASSEGGSAMVDLNGTVEWTTRGVGNVVQVSAGPSGIVFVASSDGTVRALR